MLHNIEIFLITTLSKVFEVLFTFHMDEEEEEIIKASEKLFKQGLTEEKIILLPSPTTYQDFFLDRNMLPECHCSRELENIKKCSI